jgi:hypothetical protein
MIDTLSLSGSDSRLLLREFEHYGLQHSRIHETTQTMSLCNKKKRTEREIRDSGRRYLLIRTCIILREFYEQYTAVASTSRDCSTSTL